MSEIETISRAIHARFCADLKVTPVPLGYAVSTGFIMPDGDPLTFYLEEADDGWVLQDDGSTLPDALASGLELASGHRERLLSSILEEEGARYDLNDYLIYTDAVSPDRLGSAAVSFVSALIRMQDLVLLSRENTRASFADDVRSGLAGKLPASFEMPDFPVVGSVGGPDIVIRDVKTHLTRARVFAANSDLRMLEAVVAHKDTGEGDSPVVVVANRAKGGVTEKRFNFATNQGLTLAVYDPDDPSWINRTLMAAGAAA